MTSNEKKNIGFFKGLNNNEDMNTIGYKKIPEPETTYKPIDTSKAATSKDRETMRIPTQQYIEFLAMLDISEYAYVYELLGEMLYERSQKLSKSDLQDYQHAIDSNRKKIEKRKLRKK